MWSARSLGLANAFPHSSQCSDLILWQSSWDANLLRFAKDFPHSEQTAGFSQFFLCFASFSPVENFLGQSSHLTRPRQIFLLICFLRVALLLKEAPQMLHSFDGHFIAVKSAFRDSTSSFLTEHMASQQMSFEWNLFLTFSFKLTDWYVNITSRMLMMQLFYI